MFPGLVGTSSSELPAATRSWAILAGMNRARCLFDLRSSESSGPGYAGLWPRPFSAEREQLAAPSSLIQPDQWSQAECEGRGRLR
jgi:hypothetical protein